MTNNTAFAAAIIGTSMFVAPYATAACNAIIGCPSELSTVDVSPDFPFGASNTDMAGRIPGIVIDPSYDAVLYAASEWAGVWKSVNGGKSWAQWSLGLRNPLTREYAYPNLAIDQLNPQRLIYATESKDGRGKPNARGKRDCEGCDFGGLWVSLDGAGSWQHVNLCSAQTQMDNISSVVFSLGRPFVATDCGIWSTSDPELTDGSWTKLPLPNGVSPGGTILAPGLFACLGDGSKVYRSQNYGQNWDAGFDVGGRCTGLAAARVGFGISIVIHETPAPVSPAKSCDEAGPGSAAFEVTVVDHDRKTTQDLGFANVARSCGSGRSGVWVAPRLSRGTGLRLRPQFDVFAADNFHFYAYEGSFGQWSDPFSMAQDSQGNTQWVHADTWWMAFPTSYTGERSSHAGEADSCSAYAAHDGGVIANASKSCSFDGWVDASSGLHVVFSWFISGVSWPNNPVCNGTGRAQPCPVLYLPSADDDTFVSESGGSSARIQGSSGRWQNFPDGLGDSGIVLIDPAQRDLALAVRNGTYNLFIGSNGQPPSSTDNPIRNIAGPDFYPGILAGGVQVVLTVPREAASPQGDYLAIRSQLRAGNCNNVNCSNDVIVRNTSARSGIDNWADISPGAQFGPGQIAGIYPAGGHKNLTVYVLTSNDPNVVKASGGSYQPGQVWKGTSRNGKPITQWLPASGGGLIPCGSGFRFLSRRGCVGGSLNRAYNLVVNPYDPNELYATDLGDPDPSVHTIKVSHDGGNSWDSVPQLKDVATNYGEFDFDCGALGANGTYYQDKEIFGDECPLMQIVFVRGHPELRFAVLYPGGLAFSRDGGNSWMPLNVTNAQPGAGQPIGLLNIIPVQPGDLQPVELPHSAFYDPQPNTSTGDTSLFVALEGKGVKRVDAPFATLTTAEIVFKEGSLESSTPFEVTALVTPLDVSVPLRLGADGIFRGIVMFDSAHVSHLQVSFLVNGRLTQVLGHSMTDAEASKGVAVLTN